MTDDLIRGAVVEIVDPSPGSIRGPILPRRVYVNGTDVGFVAKDGIHINRGGLDEPTTVTLTLLPSRVILRGTEKPE